jgi:hypothetical protein
MWQQATAPGTYSWEQALTYCENLTLAGKNDWRLPTIRELASIVDYSRFPLINSTYFPGIQEFYWSSTTNAYYPDSAWIVDFVDGVDYYGKSVSIYVRAVRGGQIITTTTVPTTTTISTTTIEVTTSTTTSTVFITTTTTTTAPPTTTTSIIDSDGDGIPDNEDNCPNKPNGPNLGTCSPSSDNPGITCTSDADCVIGCSTNGKCSLNQEDTDFDGKGDVCDNCPITCNPLQSDANGNGIGDLCDTDPGCGGCTGIACEQACES